MMITKHSAWVSRIIDWLEELDVKLYRRIKKNQFFLERMDIEKIVAENEAYLKRLLRLK
jgi:hypothetical protein